MRRPGLVSVVVPVLDERDGLEAQLHALAAQEASWPFEVVVADNGSGDGSRELAEEWAAAGERRAVVDASRRRGPGAARNAGAEHARGDLLAFCDADDVVAPGWIEAIAAAAADADLVAGRISEARLNGPLPRAWHGRPPQAAPPRALGFLPFASGSNCAMWADWFEHLGGFDDRLMAGEDIDLSWRAQLDGVRLAFAPDAVVERRYRAGLPALARQHYRYGRAYAGLYTRFRHRGLRRPPARAFAHECHWLAANAARAARDVRTRGVWVRRAAERAGRLAGSAENRVLFP